MAAGKPCPAKALSSVAHGLKPANGVTPVIGGVLFGPVEVGTGAGRPPSWLLHAAKAHTSTTTEAMAERPRISPVTR
jgi:hypothetical protein